MKSLSTLTPSAILKKILICTLLLFLIQGGYAQSKSKTLITGAKGFMEWVGYAVNIGTIWTWLNPEPEAEYAGIEDIRILKLEWNCIIYQEGQRYEMPHLGLLILNLHTEKGTFRVKSGQSITEMDVNLLADGNVTVLKCGNPRIANTNYRANYSPDNFRLYPNGSMNNLDDNGIFASVNWSHVQNSNEYERIALYLDWRELIY